jgi:quinol monooxygenase YgiN
MEIFIFARFHAKPGNEAAVAEALLEVALPSREEPGCLGLEDLAKAVAQSRSSIP